jgi:hypothetical protein
LGEAGERERERAVEVLAWLSLATSRKSSIMAAKVVGSRGMSCHAPQGISLQGGAEGGWVPESSVKRSAR